MLNVSKILRFGEGRTVKRLSKLADAVIAVEEDFSGLTDAELSAKTQEFKDRIAAGETVDDLIIEAFAVAREASWRVLGQKHYKVQIMGGAALHEGNVAEMRTGEGKTLTCVLPAYLNALEGKGVHVVTVNDYLAKRDAEWMGRVHRFLGLKTDVILSQMRPDERRTAYLADITYGTNNELGFDYLRDNMAHTSSDLVQRGHHYAVIDEVDSILIDEARTPLIISGPVDGDQSWYREFSRMAPLMQKDIHYEVDIRKRTIGIKEIGVEFVEDQLGIDNLYEPEHSSLVSYLNNSIKAKELFTKDKDYIVRRGEVMIVDEFTGRVLDGRRYNEGMHQAIEAKENVEIKSENQTLATITLQNYFRLYDKLSGMTGTAETEASELHQIYGLDVVPIPTNRESQRDDMSDLIYKTQEAKFAAVADDIAERNALGQPVLVGTTSVERSEYLSKLLDRRGIKHNVLNAKFHDQEAQFVAEAGRLKAVTVATNMAGRGTDVVLGGNPDIICDITLRKRGLDPVEDPEKYQAAWDEEIDRARERARAEAEKVREVGGLYVLGTERHESRRIDNQLRGRSGRQGDPGTTRFYLSLRDELMVRFNGAAVESIMNRLNVPDDVPIEAKMVSNQIKSAQATVEGQNYEIRRNVLKYDEVLNQQRTEIYKRRREILAGSDVQVQVQSMIDAIIADYVEGATAEGYLEDWQEDGKLTELWEALGRLYGPTMSYEDLIASSEYGKAGELKSEDLIAALRADAHAQYEAKETAIGELVGRPEAMRDLERQLVLQTIDRRWREHLYEMDYLKEGIGLRAMAQRDPLVEYQREGYDLFLAMYDSIKEDVITALMHVGTDRVAQANPQVKVGAQPQLNFTGPAEGGGTETTADPNAGGRAARRA